LKNTVEIKVGICIAYDWEMLKTALPLFYNQVDLICLSLDINRETWSGNKFIFNEIDFFSYVKMIDTQNKIIIYQDDFCVDKQNPMKGEVFQRNQMAKKLGKGGWHIQIDVDEYFVDIESLVLFLRKTNLLNKKDLNICLPFYIMFKHFETTSLFIKGRMEWVPVVTNNPNYEYGRRNGYFNYKFNSPIIHQSWARTDKEIQQKVNNWGHKTDFDGVAFYEKWAKLDLNNYKKWINFHPIDGKVWHELVAIEGHSIDELVVKNKSKFKILRSDSPLKIWLKNFRLISRIFQIFQIKW